MKKLFTILCAGLITFGLSAQTDAGQIYIDANVSNFNYSSMKLTKKTTDGEDVTPDEVDAENNLQLGSTVGYFIMDGLLAGATLNIDNMSQGDDKLNTFEFGPMVRYYISDIGVFAQASYVFGSIGNGEADEKINTSNLSIGAGYAVMLSDNVSLNPMFNYNMAGRKYGDPETKERHSGISIGASLSITM